MLQLVNFAFFQVEVSIKSSVVKHSRHLIFSNIEEPLCYIFNIHLEMCLEITFSHIAKYPETFFDASKTGQTEKSYIFQEFGFPEIYVRLFEFFQNLIALQV